MENKFFTFKKFILPRLGICRSGRPHHSPPLPQVSPVDCVLLMLLHTQQYGICWLTDHCTQAN